MIYLIKTCCGFEFILANKFADWGLNVWYIWNLVLGMGFVNLSGFTDWDFVKLHSLYAPYLKIDVLTES